MNWEATGALGEIVGAFGVIVSVVYLALQVRDNTHASVLAATRELFLSFNEAAAQLTASDVNAEIWLVGSRDQSKLGHRDSYRFSQLLLRIFSNFEQQYFHREEKLMYSQIFESQIRAFEVMLSYPGVRTWWSDNKQFFSAEYQAHINEIIEAHPVREPSSFQPELIKLASRDEIPPPDDATESGT